MPNDNNFTYTAERNELRKENEKLKAENSRFSSEWYTKNGEENQLREELGKTQDMLAMAETEIARLTKLKNELLLTIWRAISCPTVRAKFALANDQARADHDEIKRLTNSIRVFHARWSNVIHPDRAMMFDELLSIIAAPPVDVQSVRLAKPDEQPCPGESVSNTPESKPSPVCPYLQADFTCSQSRNECKCPACGKGNPRYRMERSEPW